MKVSMWHYTDLVPDIAAAIPQFRKRYGHKPIGVVVREEEFEKDVFKLGLEVIVATDIARRHFQLYPAVVRKAKRKVVRRSA